MMVDGCGYAVSGSTGSADQRLLTGERCEIVDTMEWNVLFSGTDGRLYCVPETGERSL